MQISSGFKSRNSCLDPTARLEPREMLTVIILSMVINPSWYILFSRYGYLLYGPLVRSTAQDLGQIFIENAITIVFLV